MSMSGIRACCDVPPLAFTTIIGCIGTTGVRRRLFRHTGPQCLNSAIGNNFGRQPLSVGHGQ